MVSSNIALLYKLVDPMSNALPHSWGMVGFHMDIVDDLPWFHVVAVGSVQQIQGQVEVVDDFLVDLHLYL